MEHKHFLLPVKLVSITWSFKLIYCYRWFVYILISLSRFVFVAILMTIMENDEERGNSYIEVKYYLNILYILTILKNYNN